MDYQNLLTDYQNGILTVTFNRPKALNALNYQVLEELKHVFEHLAPSLQGLKGIILTGTGEKAFVAGADISEFQGLDPQQGAALAQRGHDIFNRIERFERPVIAAINGYALGGGCELAMACHLRIASENARFGQPEVNLGLIPGYGGTQRLVRYLGKTKALELMLTADMFSATDALAWGLVNYVTPAGEEVKKAQELIGKIATKAPIAVAKVIEAVNAYDGSEAGFDKEIAAFGGCMGSEDVKEGVAAFLEKRKPIFQGK